MRLLYGTTTELVVTITERFFGGQYRLYFAEHFNASPSNPPTFRTELLIVTTS